MRKNLQIHQQIMNILIDKNIRLKLPKHVNIPMHSHNMLLEIAYNYGIFIAILLAAFVGLIIYKIGKIIFSNDSRLSLCTTKALYASMDIF